MSVDNVKISPMFVYLGKDTPQVQKITTIPSIATTASLAGKYFLFQDAAGAKHFAWFDDGVVADVVISGYTAHPVVMTEPETAASIATKLTAVLTAVTGFDATASGNVVTLTHTANGFANPARDPDDPTVASGFAFKLVTVGQVEVEAGCIDGDIELKGLKPETEDVKCQHTGTTVQARLVKGYPPMEATMTFNETDATSLKAKFIAAGHYPFLPVGGSLDAFGYGPTLVGQQVPTIAMRLHPVALDASDKSQDWNFWKVQGLLESFNFSGEKISVIPMTFSIFPDKTKNKEVQFFMIGDSSQSGLGV